MICEKCVEKLIQDEQTLVCPECGKRHRAENGVMTFPQKKYILENISDNEVRCKNHSNELFFYCKQKKFEKLICNSCLVEEHIGHELREIDELEKEQMVILQRNVDTLKGNLDEKKRVLIQTKEEVAGKNVSCLEKLKNRKEEIVRKFDGMIENAERRKLETEKDIVEALKVTDENISLLKNVKLTETITGKSPTLSDFLASSETLD